MNRLEAGALGYPTLAGKTSPSPIVQLPRFDGASSGIPPGKGRQFRLRLTRGRCGPEIGLRTAAGYFGCKVNWLWSGAGKIIRSDMAVVRMVFTEDASPERKKSRRTMCISKSLPNGLEILAWLCVFWRWNGVVSLTLRFYPYFRSLNRKYAGNMQKKYAKKYSKKFANKYAKICTICKKYALYAGDMQTKRQGMQKKGKKYAKICKICNKYVIKMHHHEISRKRKNMQKICKICTHTVTHTHN